MGTRSQNKEGNILRIIILFALVNSSVFIAIGGSGIPRFIAMLLMNLSGLLLLYTFVNNLKRFKKAQIGLYFKFVFLLLILWSLFTIFRSFSFQGKRLITLFGHYLMGWAWLTPLAVIFGFNILNWPRLFNFFGKFLLVASIIGLFCFFYPISYNFGLFESFAFLPILLLTFFFQSKKIKWIVLFSIPVFILVTYTISQRVNVLFLALIILFTFIQFLRLSEIKPEIKIVVIVLLSIACLVVIIKFEEFTNRITQNEELTTDTRTFLFEELFLDMSHTELWLGRGAMGTYYSPYFDYTSQQGLEGDSETRSINEVGYLEMILKGGYVMMLLYILILLPAAFLGIFRSKNIISKMCGYFILAYLIVWGISYYPVYSAEYILLWMAAGTAISGKNRRLTNKQVLFKKRNKLNFIK